MARSLLSRSEAERILNLALLVLGLSAATLAVWVFYLHPWLGMAFQPLDFWFDAHRCQIAVLCGEGLALPSQPGMLAAGLSVVLLGLGLSGYSPAKDAIAVGHGTAAGLAPIGSLLERWQTLAVVPLAALAGGLVIALAAETSGRRAPDPRLWLVTLAITILGALILDVSSPRELLRTVADLGVALGIAVTTIGLSCLLNSRPIGLSLLAGGLLLLCFSSYAACRLSSLLTSTDHLLMFSLGVLATLLALRDPWSWRFAFIGDEWSFYTTARELLHNPDPYQLLGVRQIGDYHSVLSSAFQAAVMWLAGEDVFGWRFSSALPFILSVPAVYVFVQWFAGRAAAFLAAGLLAGSHVLINFSMAAYNNTQALIPLTIGLGMVAFAARGRGALRFLLTGVVIGLGFFAYGLARLAVIPIGIFLLYVARPTEPKYRLSWVSFLVGALVSSLPMLILRENWQAMLKATPAESEVTVRGVSVPVQMLGNGIRGLFAVLAGSNSSHFIAGPHADPLTAILVLAGVGCAVAGIRRHDSARVFLLAGGLFTLAVGAIQQYGFVSNTRAFILPPIYAVFGGLGGVAVARLLFPRDRAAFGALLGAFIVVAVALNLFHAERISLDKPYWPIESRLLQQLQESRAGDGGGMRAYVVLNTPRAPRENLIFRANEVGRERLTFLTREEAAETSVICRSAKEPALMLVDARISQIDAIRRRVADCWPGSEEQVVMNGPSEKALYRFATKPAQDDLGRKLVERASSRQHPDSFGAVRPLDIATDRDGRIYVLSRPNSQPASVEIFARDGSIVSSFTLERPISNALALTPDGWLIAASADNTLTWYDAAGRSLRQTDRDARIGDPRDVTVRQNGEILVADSQGKRVVRLSPDGSITGSLTGRGTLSQPARVAVGADGGIWVLDAVGRLLKLSDNDEVLASLSVPPTPVDNAYHFVPLANDEVIVAEPETPRLSRRDLRGNLLDVISGFEHPMALAIDSDGRLLVADPDLDTVGILPRIADAPRPVAVRVRRLAD